MPFGRDHKSFMEVVHWVGMYGLAQHLGTVGYRL